MARVFVSQELLDLWTDQGRIELSGHSLTLRAQALSFDLRPAARFLGLAAGTDATRLLGKVKDEAQLRELGAEIYLNSVLNGEDAYDVQSGFVADGGLAVAFGGTAEMGSSPPKREGGSDAERAQLAKFLLEDLG